MMEPRWVDANQAYLAAEIGRVRRLLAAHGHEGPRAGAVDSPPPWPASLADPPALTRLAEVFGLSSFERDVLLLCAAYELDASVAGLCGARPTFRMALGLFPDGHWSALAPAAPLRYWRMVEVVGDGGLTGAGLRIDERVLHHLIGVDYLDDRLTALVRPVQRDPAAEADHIDLAQTILARWQADGRPWRANLFGDDPAGQRAVASLVAAAMGARLYLLQAEDIPVSPYERETMARLWERESALSPVLLLVNYADEPGRAAVSLVESLGAPVLVMGRAPLPAADPPMARFAVNRQRWRVPVRSNGSGNRAAQDGHDPLADQSLLGLAQRIEPMATWEDLVLPPAQIALLREIAGQVRQLATVYETWGFASRSQRGLGISALFVGESGTGKTMAAEVLANELGLPLYRVDLSAVVSKYIGETEKNLRRVFDAAEAAGVILLFDEADALFGKRSEVKDSHDRYANIEVSYLLQRMESYAGLAILTTNFKSALDPAFLRRIRFVVTFPFPDAGQRAEIWRRIFPQQTPLDGVDIGRLTRLSVAGGHIRNIAVNAAFLAADAGEPVSMVHLLRAARREYAKLEKPFNEGEFAIGP